VRKIKVKLSAIRQAIKRAKLVSDDWQAECCEILSIPAIAKRWQELNPNLRGLRIWRVAGQPYRFESREINIARCDAKQWGQIAGYVLVLFSTADGDCSWNSVRPDYYGHSASTAWDGVRRDTVSQFVLDLRMLAYGHDHAEIRNHLASAGIELVDDAALVAA
jgi:hypothetical protein